MYVLGLIFEKKMHTLLNYVLYHKASKILNRLTKSILTFDINFFTDNIKGR